MSSLSNSSLRPIPIVHQFDLVEGMKLQVNVSGASNGAASIVGIQLINCSRPLILHWGGICNGQTNWVLPENYPSGTTVYKNKALRTPFVKSGELYLVSIELRDPKFVAIEFVLKDRRHDQWFKLNKGNFRIEIPKLVACISPTLIPKDLVEKKAYLIWESKGKPKSSPQEEKEDYDIALKELQSQMAMGISLDDLKSSLKASSIGRISNSKGIASSANKLLLSVCHKRHDVTQWLNKQPLGHSKGNNVLQSSLFCHVEKTFGGDNVNLRQSFNVGKHELVVLLKTISSEYHIIIAANLRDPTVLHWGVSKMSAGEWMVPPLEILPERSKLVNGACQSYFKEMSGGQASLQYLDINLKGRNFIGLQFVIWSGGSWIKNNGSNFYINLNPMESIMGKGEGERVEICKWLLDEIAEREKDAERSLMHRFNIAIELTERCQNEGALGLIGILVWLRFMACRQLCWNKNYNVKPRDISATQDRFTDLLQRLYTEHPADREILRLIMANVGRGGQGDIGQRIRDEILVLQRNNDCKGGMMEEWHQKLHNNSSPDDIIICQALMDYVKSNFDMDVYWRTINRNGLTKRMLASYDRPIVSEPRFRADSKEGLIHDLTAYLKTLKAVHSGADLESAIATCLGRFSKLQNHGMTEKVDCNSSGCFSTKLRELLNFIQEHAGDVNAGPLVEKLLESRIELRPILFGINGRMKDYIYLDLALDLSVKIHVERSLGEMKNAPLQNIMTLVSLMLENLCLSMMNNEDLIYITKDWYHACDLYKPSDQQWSLRTKAVLDRLQLALADKAQYYQKKIQPSAEYLGKLLRVETDAVVSFSEELIRAGSGATLSILVNQIEPFLRKLANLGSWQVISSVEVCGFLDCVNELRNVQSKVFSRPTIIISNRVTGEEEIPEGVVGLLTPDLPDVLSHVSIRARNSKVCFASSFDQNILQDLRSKKGKAISIRMRSSSLIYNEIKNSFSSLYPMSSSFIPDGVILKKKKFNGKFSISADEFSNDLVGAKSNNIVYLRGRVPSWIKIPTSVALPFGVFEASIMAEINKDLAKNFLFYSGLVNSDDLSKLQVIQDIILQMKAPTQLINELKNKMKCSKLFWPGDDGEERWNQAWQAIKKVWASKWNERAYVSCTKAKMKHEDLSMAVLVQEVIVADYAFVVHTRNPLSGDPLETYTEIVKGLGETLVGAHPGRAMSFTCKKSASKSPIVTGYPSKPIGLFVKNSLIFRSDSNGEDLKGYAGAGLYDSIIMDKVERVVLDYSSDQLVNDTSFQESTFRRIAEAGKIIEGLYGSAQDIEGVVKDGEIYVVQTRPQI